MLRKAISIFSKNGIRNFRRTISQKISALMRGEVKKLIPVVLLDT